MQQGPWIPTVDGEFLTDTPYNLISQGRFEHKDALLGVNQNEGMLFLLSLPGFSKDGPSLLNLTMFRNGVDIIDRDLSKQQVSSTTHNAIVITSTIHRGRATAAILAPEGDLLYWIS